MGLYLEYGGGLGDIFRSIFHEGGYCALAELGSAERATVVLITHNPHARELFDYHPRAGQLDIIAPGYWPATADRTMRTRLGLTSAPPQLPAPSRTPEFYPSAGDHVWLDRLEGLHYVVFSPTAGMPERDIPRPLVRELVSLAYAYDLRPVFVGRNYDRWGRREQRPNGAAAIDLIDKLTVPGTALVVRGAAGVVCCHSAVNMLAWLLRKPQLLLYPQSVQDQHIARRDQCAFGIDFEECRHTLVSSPDVRALAAKFFADLRKDQRMDEVRTPAPLETSRPPLTGFDAFTDKLLSDATPMGQNTSSGNIGFGWIYYGLVRNLNPDLVIIIGSCAGFSPFCAGRALRDNGWGKVVFIDPSYSGNGEPGWGGQGNWSDPAAVAARIAAFGLTGWVEHLKLRSEEAFPIVEEMARGQDVGLVIIDGSHTFENSLRDFDMYSQLVRDGCVVFHDATSADCEVLNTIDLLRTRGYPVLMLARDVGLAIVEIHRAAAVKETWGYLCAESDRGELLLPYAKRLLRPGDRVLDIYCGFSPLAPLVHGVEIFGFDVDRGIVEELRDRKPEHRWEQVSERQLPFAELPAHIDVLMGLGLSRGHAPWDPQYALQIVRYLLGRYYPRACLFESAADYYGCDILDDLRQAVARLRYRCDEDVISTSMANFSRRKVLVVER